MIFVAIPQGLQGPAWTLAGQGRAAQDVEIRSERTGRLLQGDRRARHRLRRLRVGAEIDDPPLPARRLSAASGPLLRFDKDQALLYTRGSVEFFRTYPGMYVPRPLQLRCQALGQPLQHVAEEMLALTKMNWNNTQFDNGLPITSQPPARGGSFEVRSRRPGNRAEVLLLHVRARTVQRIPTREELRGEYISETEAYGIASATIPPACTRCFRKSG
jgi:hypothetical protein